MRQIVTQTDGSLVARLPPVTHAECLTLRNILLRIHPASQWEAGFIESMATLLQQAAQGRPSQGRPPQGRPPLGLAAGD